MIQPIKAYLVGSGIGSLAAAAFMIRDGDVPGDRITIFEADAVAGGALDGGGDPVEGYSLRGGRMLTTDNYECTWDLFRTIPALGNTITTVFDETMAFNERHKSHAMARLVDRRRARVPVRSMGFSMQDRLELLELHDADESSMGASRITDWLSPASSARCSTSTTRWCGRFRPGWRSKASISRWAAR
jgi:oleate hydratase